MESLSRFHRRIAVLSLAGASSWLLRPPKLAASPGLHTGDKTKTLVTGLRQPVVQQNKEKVSFHKTKTLHLSFNQQHLAKLLPNSSYGCLRSLGSLTEAFSEPRFQCRT